MVRNSFCFFYTFFRHFLRVKKKVLTFSWGKKSFQSSAHRQTRRFAATGRTLPPILCPCNACVTGKVGYGTKDINKKRLVVVATPPAH